MSDSSTFNLLDEPWIPVTLTSGEAAELSLIEALERATEIANINGDLPVQRFAIIRLLLAAMYAAIPGGPPNAQQSEYVRKYGEFAPFSKIWTDIWHNGVPTIVLTRLKMFRTRFDLLDLQEPFFQVAELHTAKGEASGLEKIVLDVPNGEPFFTTRIGEGLDSMSFAEAARWLVTIQAYDPSGIKTGAVGDSRVNGGRGYPIGVAWTGQLGGLLICGETLAKTLALNFVGQDDQSASWRMSNDCPAWERPQSTAEVTVGLNQTVDKDLHIDETGQTRFFHGPATLFTWQSRRIRLFHDGMKVTGVIIANGDRLKPQNGQRFEPMTAWRRSESQERALKMHPVYMPIQHRPERSLWRGVANLLPGGSVEQQAERISSLSSKWLATLYARGALERDDVVSVQAYGLVYGSNDSVVAELIDDELDLHLSVLASEDVAIHGMMDSAISLADTGVSQVRNLAGNLANSAGLDSSSARIRAGERAYAALDGLFRSWLIAITAETDYSEALDLWLQTVRAEMLRLGAALINELGSRAWIGRELKIGSNLRFVNAAVADLWFRKGVAKHLGYAADTEDSYKQTDGRDTHHEKENA